MPRKTVTNWGNYPRVEANVTESGCTAELEKLIAASENLIARGNGRCYGDSSLGDNIFSTLRLNKFIEFDSTRAEIECESGVLLSDVLNVVVSRGFFLPVTPGTKFVTVGGAIAADVHGKNHHIDGSFANHVIHLDLLQADGTTTRCSPAENADLFWQTCGGMGLTGVIVSARFRLKPIETSFISQTSIKTNGIDATMKAFETTADATYSVAWLDCFAAAGSLGRSLLQTGEHAKLSDLPARLVSSPLRLAPADKLGLPFFLPSFALNYASVKAFNTAYYHRQLVPQVARIIHFDPFFYPLDSIRDWNRVYGRGGFVQYQFVLPLAASYDGIVRVLEKVRKSGQGSPLAVLKLFGKPNPNAVMSFPMEGFTLTLDFKASSTVFQLLDQLDEIVLENKGRIYLAKDARMQPKIFKATYDRIVPSGFFRSAQSTRLEF